MEFIVGSLRIRKGNFINLIRCCIFIRSFGEKLIRFCSVSRTDRVSQFFLSAADLKHGIFFIKSNKLVLVKLSGKLFKVIGLYCQGKSVALGMKLSA